MLIKCGHLENTAVL